MKRNWETDELIEHFTFLPNEIKVIGNKTGGTRLGFAVLFKFFQNEARFPYHRNEVPKAVVEYIAKNLRIAPALYADYDWSGRSITYHRSQIRDFFEFREPTIRDAKEIKEWLFQHVLPHDHDPEYIKEEIYAHLRELKVEPPMSNILDRTIFSALSAYENRLFKEIAQRFPSDLSARIDDFIEIVGTDGDEGGHDDCCTDDEVSFSEMKAGPGSIGLKTVFQEISKLKSIQELRLPEGLFHNISPKIIKKYRQRVASEDVRELRRHPQHIRHTLLAAFFWLRRTEVTDNL